MNKKNFTETDIRSKFVNPALLNAGWNLQTQILEEVPTSLGKVLVRGVQAQAW